MFVPIRRDPIVFRETHSYSDASALQKNVINIVQHRVQACPGTV